MMNSQNTGKTPVVLDKSYAQSAKHGALQRLADDYVVLITSSFYFEAFQNLEESRKKIFAGFPEFRRIHSPLLLRHERQNLAPADSIEAVPLNVNPAIVSGKHLLSEAEQKCMADFEGDVRLDIEFWNAVIERGVVGFEASEIKATANNFHAFRKLLERLRETKFIREVAAQMNYPQAEILDSEWYTFRFLQARLLHGLTLNFLSHDRQWKRPDEVEMEHDVHDIDYLTLGLHARCFACNESKQNFRKLGWRFNFLCPDGLLLQTYS